MDLMGYFNELSGHKESPSRVLRAPFSYHGGKAKSLSHLLRIIPYRNSYIEVFGGSAALLLARKPSVLDVYNDRFGGVVCFYRCLRDRAKCDKLLEWMKASVHSREEFFEGWKDQTDEIERAARWYYTTMFSFAKTGTSFGRSTDSLNPLPAAIRRHYPDFLEAHLRLRDVLIENRDWRTMFRDFDSPTAVIYCDPPYLESEQKYEHKMPLADHIELCEIIMRSVGYVALSGRSACCDIYDNYDWTAREEWLVNDVGSTTTRAPVKEFLWIKE